LSKARCCSRWSGGPTAGAHLLDARIDAKRLPSGDVLLRDIRLTVGAGEVVALLGASGTGKTSTLRILLGLDRDFAGAVRRSARRVGAVFQEPRLLPWRSVADNIRLVIPRGQLVPDIGALLRDVGLPGSEALYPAQMSLGMARRAALARALAIAPDLLILDEPFASLDPSASGVIAACLSRHQQARQSAVVMALHDIDRATTLATRIIVLAGRPATVAYRADIAPDAGVAERARVRAELTGLFPFVSDATAQGDRPT
jgi:NitT/TauT family transport system ATP-binding protein